MNNINQNNTCTPVNMHPFSLKVVGLEQWEKPTEHKLSTIDIDEIPVYSKIVREAYLHNLLSDDDIVIAAKSPITELEGCVYKALSNLGERLNNKQPTYTPAGFSKGNYLDVSLYRSDNNFFTGEKGDIRLSVKSNDLNLFSLESLKYSHKKVIRKVIDCIHVIRKTYVYFIMPEDLRDLESFYGLSEESELIEFIRDHYELGYFASDAGKQEVKEIYENTDLPEMFSGDILELYESYQNYLLPESVWADTSKIDNPYLYMQDLNSTIEEWENDNTELYSDSWTAFLCKAVHTFFSDFPTKSKYQAYLRDKNKLINYDDHDLHFGRCFVVSTHHPVEIENNDYHYSYMSETGELGGFSFNTNVVGANLFRTLETTFNGLFLLECLHDLHRYIDENELPEHRQSKYRF